jgi:phage-related minor tail protein
MAANSNRALTLSIVADIDNLQKGLNKADAEIETFGSRVGDFGKKAAAAFAVAAAAAVAYGTKLAIDGVKAAIEDEQAQLRLANALREATGATDEQIKATEDMITKTSLATGVADDQLRPALQRLAFSTKDAGEAQKLLTLALDVSKGSGKDLESVANALAKAHDGQNTALARLGVGLSAAELKTMSFEEIQIRLAELLGGSAAANAETFQGKIDILTNSINEAKEGLGTALLPTVEKFITYLNDVGVPTLNGFIAGLTGNEGLSAALTESQRGAESFGKAIAAVAGIISGFITFVREAIGLLVEFANQAIRLVNIIKPGADVGYIPNPSLTGTMLGQSNRSSLPNGGYTTGGGVTNITVNAIDGEGAARAVASVLNQSAARSQGLLVGTTVGR